MTLGNASADRFTVAGDEFSLHLAPEVAETFRRAAQMASFGKDLPFRGTDKEGKPFLIRKASFQCCGEDITPKETAGLLTAKHFDEWYFQMFSCEDRLFLDVVEDEKGNKGQKQRITVFFPIKKERRVSVIFDVFSYQSPEK